MRYPLPLVAAAAPLVLAGCGDSPTEDSGPGTEVAEAYMTSALDIMQANSINRYVVDWPTLRAGAMSRIVGATTPTGTYPTIEWALDELGDNHSFFRPPSGQALLTILPGEIGALAAQTQSSPEPTTMHFGEGIAYVLVPWFSGGGSAATEMATLYHTRIEEVDTLGVCGWVVDLRGNTGGNMWPMIAGVGPILGEGVAGYFIDPDTVEAVWGYEGGASYLESGMVVTVPSPYELLRPYPPVAVLTDHRTASSGEATTIAFRERPSTRSFGQGTYGVSTANSGFPLSDGAVIYLTVSTMADRTKRWYGGVVEPDEPLDPDTPGTVTLDGVLDRAVDWLKEQPACAGQA